MNKKFHDLITENEMKKKEFELIFSPNFNQNSFKIIFFYCRQFAVPMENIAALKIMFVPVIYFLAGY